MFGHVMYQRPILRDCMFFWPVLSYGVSLESNGLKQAYQSGRDIRHTYPLHVTNLWLLKCHEKPRADIVKICVVWIFVSAKNPAIDAMCKLESGCSPITLVPPRSEIIKCILAIWPLAGQKRSDSPCFVLVEQVQSNWKVVVPWSF